MASMLPLQRHAVGLAFAACLGLVCYAVFRMVPWLLGGTIIEALGQVVTFVMLIVTLSLGERLWAVVAARLASTEDDH